MASLKISEEDRASVLVLTLTGEVDSRSARDLHKKLLTSLAEGRRGLMLDLTGLNAIDGAGLRVMMATSERLEAEGGALAVCGVHSDIQRVLEMAGMDRSLSIFRDQEAGWQWVQETVHHQRLGRLAVRLLSQDEDSVRRYPPSSVDKARLEFAVELLERAERVSRFIPQIRT